MYGYNHLGKKDLKSVDDNLMNFDMLPKGANKSDIFTVGKHVSEIPTGGLYKSDNGGKVVRKIGMSEGKRLRGLTKRRMK